MPYVNPIPCPPGEDYNQQQSLQIALTSLTCLISSFDSVIDSLESSTERINRRVDRLVERYELIESHIAEEKDRTSTFSSPESYPKVVTSSLDNNITSVVSTSFLKQARDNSNKGIEDCIQEEKNLWIMEGNNHHTNIKLSDNWLDRGDAFEEQLLCRMYSSLHTTPLLDTGVLESSNCDEDADAVGTVTAMASNVSRTQQGLSGSAPFLCELLHDSYGCTNSLGVKEDCQVLPVVETLDMLGKHS